MNKEEAKKRIINEIIPSIQEDYKNEGNEYSVMVSLLGVNYEYKPN
jgi:hypothetical protein